MKRSGKILLEGTIEEFKKHCKGAEHREYLLINTNEIKKDGTYAVYKLDWENERVIPISNISKYKKLPFIPYNKQYLTFVALSDGTFSWSGQTNGGASNCSISYSLNGGRTWSTPSTTVNIEVKTNDKVLWKGEMTPGTYGSDDWYGIGRFNGGTAQFDIQGNIMSLLYGDNFVDPTLELKAHAFRFLFAQTNIVNANNLVLPSTTASSCCISMFRNCTLLITAPQLPATTLAAGCYQSMFRNCTSLTTAPELPATTLIGLCYIGMFQNCTNLNYIKAMFTTIPSNTYTLDWVNGVATNGTFVKSSDATWEVRGIHGIPSGWTVEEATE